MEAATFPSPTLPQDAAQRLLAEWDRVHDELRPLLKISRHRDITHAESIQLAWLVRRIAVISSALHGHITSALTDAERAWLATQGVPIGI